MLRKITSRPSLNRPYLHLQETKRYLSSSFTISSLRKRLQVFVKSMSSESSPVPLSVAIFIHGVGATMASLVIVWVYAAQGGAGWFVEDANLLFNVSATKPSGGHSCSREAILQWRPKAVAKLQQSTTVSEPSQRR